ncbi:MAG: crossover junction endodeoxyribonuclease RuvC [Pseudomonadota bacterium]
MTSSSRSVRIIGIDPGLRQTGWGLIESDGVRLRHIASGRISPPTSVPLSDRLRTIFDELTEIIVFHGPDEAAVEETFVNDNPRSTLKLGQARGAAVLAPACRGLTVGEYAPNLIKKSIVGAGHADKRQITAMVGFLLPKAVIASADEADALAIAICHANHRTALVRHAVAG